MLIAPPFVRFLIINSMVLITSCPLIYLLLPEADPDYHDYVGR